MMNVQKPSAGFTPGVDVLMLFHAERLIRCLQAVHMSYMPKQTCLGSVHGHRYTMAWQKHTGYHVAGVHQEYSAVAIFGMHP